jgi:hypothetical protein
MDNAASLWFGMKSGEVYSAVGAGVKKRIVIARLEESLL